jgi:exosortase N
MKGRIFNLATGILRATRCWPLMIAACYVLVLLIGLKDYLIWDSAGCILGMIALVTTASCNRHERGGVRFFFITAGLFILFLVLPAKTLLYLSCLSACVFLAETFYGRINILPLLVLLIMSPLFEYATNVFSFPIRLEITVWAGQMMGMIGMPVSVHGNMIFYEGNEFSVDPACMGLQMMVTSLLCGLMLIGVYQKRYGKELVLWQVLLILFLITVLNILSNLLRIICLVWLHIMPGTAMHDLTGILCLVIYVLLPVLLLTPLVIMQYGRRVAQHRKRYVLRSAMKMFVLNTLLAIAMLVAVGVKETRDINKTVPADIPVVAGYTGAALPGNIIRLENDSLLVYIKHIPSSYYSEHHPMICWKGSGYNFYRVQEEMTGGTSIYTAQLQQEDEQLYTAWWYDNGLVTTSSQLHWRWDVLLGAHPYSLVNVTAASEDALKKAVTAIIRDRPFMSLL